MIRERFRTAPDLWRPSREDDPIAVATAYVARRIVEALRALWPDVSIRSLQRELGVTKAVSERWLTTGNMTFAEVILVAAHFGDSILDAIPRTQVDLLPESYRPLVSSWTPGTPLRFASAPSADDPSWQSAAEFLVQWLQQQAIGGRARLIQRTDLALPVAEALERAGFPAASLCRVGDDPAYDVFGRVPRSVGCVYLPDHGITPQTAVQSLVDVFAASLTRKLVTHFLALESVGYHAFATMFGSGDMDVRPREGLIEMPSQTTATAATAESVANASGWTVVIVTTKR